MTFSVRAAIYARISRDATGEGLGVERQLADSRKIAATRGWTVAEEYVDNDISAYASKRRPAYERMLEDIAAGQRDAVIVYNTDRLTRRPIELEQFTQICEAAGVTQLVAVTGDINLGNDDGMFMARVLAAVAAKESGRKSERLKRKALETAEAGKPNGGRRPFGYTADQLDVVESEAAVIRALAQRYLAGESLGSLTSWLQDENVPTVYGAQWQTSTIRQTLKNPRIAGLRAHNGVVVGDAMWPAIITPQVHHQLVAMFERKTASDRRVPRRYLLSGLLRCGKCGGKLFSSARVDRRRYVCMSGPDHGGCGGILVTASPIEELITEAVLYQLDTPEMADALAGRAAADDRHAGLLAELQSDQAQMQELAGLWAAKQISSQEWKAAREPIEARIYQTERQLTQLSGDNSLAGLVGNGGELRERWGTLNLTRQAAIVAAVLDYAIVNPVPGGVNVFDPSRVVPVWNR
jgi:DNA invertase Pin-like site-specific DNA recombinase